jgi:hypothetical protein
MSKQPKSPRPAGSPKNEMTTTPSKDDVHEQREPDQEKEGVVTKPAPEASSGTRRSQR